MAVARYRGNSFSCRLALLVENLDRLQPARLRRTVQLAQITERPLTRTAGRPYRSTSDQSVILASSLR